MNDQTEDISNRQRADRVIAEAAHDLGFDSIEHYFKWMDLESERRANLLLRPTERLGAPTEHEPEKVRLGNPIANSFTLNRESVVEDVREIEQAAGKTASAYAGELRRIADEVDSAVRRKHLYCVSEFSDSERERLECPVLVRERIGIGARGAVVENDLLVRGESCGLFCETCGLRGVVNNGLAHSGSPLVGVSAAGTADDVEPIVGDAGGAEPLDAPPAPSTEEKRS